MKAVIQRVKKAQVEVEGKVVGKIDTGFLVLLGVGIGDTKEQSDYLVKKISKLRVFEDENEKMNLGLKDVNGKILVISQFTLYGETKDGNRPSFINAEKPDKANEMYEYFKTRCKEEGLEVQSGIFGAHMEVTLQNSGPVTIIIEK